MRKFLDLSGLKTFLDNLRAERPVVELTSAEYAALEQAGTIDPKAIYFITDSDVAGRNPDTEMSSTSTNTVQNKVIKAYVDSHSGGSGTVDTEMSGSSENAVQNKVIKAYIDAQKITVDASVSSTSTNPVQNKVIKAYVDDNIPSVPDVDTEMSSSSTNPVQNKVIKAYVDNSIPTIDSAISSTSTNPVQNKVIKDYVDSQLQTLRTELVSMINSITDVVASDSAPTDTSKVWIDTGA